jgi:PhoH-like ATPase
MLKCDEPKTKDHAIVKGDYLVPLRNYSPCKVKPANTEQAFALELLRDDSIPLVTLFGAAGSGKTFLACAHMLHALQKGLTGKIIIAKNLTPVGREIGFLPGSLEEKVIPFLGPFYDNFLKLGKSKYEIEETIRKEMIEISPLTFIQGRSISNAILCIDEIQNSLNMDIVKQIITRAGDNCKVILLGDPSQRFEKGEIDLEYLVNKGKSSDLVGHLSMRKSVRSPLANWAVENL